MAEIEDLSTTDASNTGRFPEGQTFSSVNNGARALEGMIARWYADTNGSIVSSGTDTVTLSAARTISAYAQGQVFIFEAGGTNTGAVTLNVDSVGAKAVVKRYNVALAAGDIVAGQIVAVAYEASADNFQLLTPPATLGAAASETVSGIIELATAAEVATGTDTARATTPAGIAAHYSTITRSRNADTTTSLTFALTDEGDVVSLSNGSAVAVTIPTNASVAFDTNTQIDIVNLGAGEVTVSGDTGVTVNGVSAGSFTLAQYAGATILKIATDTWVAPNQTVA